MRTPNTPNNAWCITCRKRMFRKSRNSGDIFRCLHCHSGCRANYRVRPVCPECPWCIGCKRPMTESRRSHGLTYRCRRCNSHCAAQYKRKPALLLRTSSKQEKPCTRCLSVKPLAAFAPQKLGWLGTTAECKSCRQLRNREYRTSHPDKVKESSRRGYFRNNPTLRRKRAEWSKNNPEKRKLQAQRYYYRNREKIKVKQRVYLPQHRAKNRATYLLAKARRRGNEKHAAGVCSPDQWKAKCDLWSWRCYLCGCQLSEKTVTIDHRIPISRGGSNWPANLAPACLNCNASKRDRTELEHQAFLRRLTMITVAFPKPLHGLGSTS